MKKRIKSIFIHILPVLLGVAMTVFLSVLVYNQIMVREEQDSWEQLDTVVQNMTEEIAFRFESNINLMQRVADAISLKTELGQQDTLLEYLESVQTSTIFQRIDIVFPGNTVMQQSGETFSVTEGQFPYEEVMARGVHFSPRTTDPQTGREVLYLGVPIVTDGEIEGMLIGMVDCLTLHQVVETEAFDGTAQVFLIDCADGSYLMDNWHEELGNLHELGQRQLLEGYEDVNFHEEILAGKVGRVAFISRSNGMDSYMVYAPVPGLNWSLAVVAQEDVILENVRQTGTMLGKIVLVELALLTSYLLWNIFVANLLVRQQENVQQMELETATNQAKSLFLSSVSHDIRTPLNGILGMLDVIDQRKDDTQLEENLRKVRISAEYLVTLADNVLDLNDLESGKGPMEEEHIDLRRLGPEMDIIVQARLKGSSVSYKMEYGPLEHPYVLGFDGYLHRILSNLIGNAIKYNKENGSILVTVEELPAGEGRSLYRFTVQDTGIGMSEEFRRKMFRAFEQEQSGARSSNTGHGLGLAIVERMVNKMGGAIRVESEKGVGTVFTVDIPFRWDPQGAHRKDARDTAVQDIAGARILLAEDNELNMEIARILLEDAGAEVTSAANGREAVEAFAASEEGCFDAVLMDIMMPELDGCQASRAIRDMKRRDAAVVPIIAMTASTFSEDIKRCRDAGMNEHVGKPLNMKTLIALVARFRSEYRDGTDGRWNA